MSCIELNNGIGRIICERDEVPVSLGEIFPRLGSGSRARPIFPRVKRPIILQLSFSRFDMAGRVSQYCYRNNRRVHDISSPSISQIICRASDKHPGRPLAPHPQIRLQKDTQCNYPSEFHDEEDGGANDDIPQLLASVDRNSGVGIEPAGEAPITLEDLVPRRRCQTSGLAPIRGRFARLNNYHRQRSRTPLGKGSTRPNQMAEYQPSMRIPRSYTPSLLL
jgi:hypothetical protein